MEDNRTILAEEIEDERLHNQFTAYFLTALRCSEVLGLRWSAIDFKNNTLAVSHTVSRAKIDGKTQLILKNRTKNKSSFWSLPLIPQVKQMLLQAREKQKRSLKSSPNRWI